MARLAVVSPSMTPARALTVMAAARKNKLELKAHRQSRGALETDSDPAHCCDPADSRGEQHGLPQPRDEDTRTALTATNPVHMFGGDQPADLLGVVLLVACIALPSQKSRGNLRSHLWR